MTTNIALSSSTSKSVLLRSLFVAGHPFKALDTWFSKSPFEGERGLKRAEVWLMRTDSVFKDTAILLGVYAVVPVLVANFVILPLTFTVTSGLAYAGLAYAGLALPSDIGLGVLRTLIALSLIIGMLVFIMKWMEFLRQSFMGPFVSMPYGVRLPPMRRELKAALLRMNFKDFMDRVRRDLGDTDARALMLLLAFPDHLESPRGGELEELMARVADLDFTKTSDTSSSVAPEVMA